MANEDEGDEWLGTTADDTDTIVLHRFYAKHGDKIGKDLLSQGKLPNDDDNSQGGKDVWIQLCAALMDIGDPLEVPQPSPFICSDHEEYIDLMSRHQHRNTDHVKDIFVETPMPQVRLTAYFEWPQLTFTIRINRQFLFSVYATSTSRLLT